jgi:DNA-binding SARP family transcriptional activator
VDKVVRFGILGTVGVWRDGLAVPVGGARQRRMLAALLLDPGRVIPAARLIDVLWDDPPDSAVKQLHNCVAEVRRRLAAGGLDPALLSTETTGYLIRADPDSIDYSRFVRMTGEGRGKARNGELAGAIERFDAALALWRGPALVDVTGRVLTSIAATFNEQRLAAVEERTALLLESGRQEEAAVEAARWFTEHPARESLAALLMRSLYGAGQQVDALEVYRVLRSRLTEDYGIEPSRRLNDLHAAILRREDLPTATPGNGERRADDAGDVEPAPSSWFSPAELPAPPQSFVGRTDPLRALDALLAPVVEGGGSRLALIAGGAGIGKSALALHWAHKVAGSFPHGQVYADLGGYSPSGPTASIEILTGVLRSFGVPPERIPQTVPAAASLYRTTLAGLRVLLLLDDAASAEQVRPLIPGGTGCVAIVTSRRTLGGLVAREGAVPVHLEPLTEPEAVRLLEQVVGPTRRTNEPRALGDLVHLCGGLPLALRIAGAAGCRAA